MKLYYHQEPGGNFGDDLNLFLWPQLLGDKLIDGHVLHEPSQRLITPVEQDKLFVGIGTLLNRRIPELPHKHIFGTGAGYGAPPKIDSSWTIHCLRGKETARLLSCDPKLAITDPAILVRTLPLKPTSSDTSAYSFMPHCATARRHIWENICRLNNIAYIDPRWNAECIIEKIRSTQVLITEALHGAIVADAFRVPWIPVTSGPVILTTKWFDWCTSIGVEYRPASIPAIWDQSPYTLRRIIRAVKIDVGVLRLGYISRMHRPNLSAPSKIEELTDRLLEALNNFKLMLR